VLALLFVCAAASPPEYGRPRSASVVHLPRAVEGWVITTRPHRGGDLCTLRRRTLHRNARGARGRCWSPVLVKPCYRGRAGPGIAGGRGRLDFLPPPSRHAKQHRHLVHQGGSPGAPGAPARPGPGLPTVH